MLNEMTPTQDSLSDERKYECALFNPVSTIVLQKYLEWCLINHAGRYTLEKSSILQENQWGMRGIKFCPTQVAKAQSIKIVNVKCSAFEVKDFKLALERNVTNVTLPANYPERFAFCPIIYLFAQCVKLFGCMESWEQYA